VEKVGKCRYILHPPLSISQFTPHLHFAKTFNHSAPACRQTGINHSIIEKVGIFYTHHYQFHNYFPPLCHSELVEPYALRVLFQSTIPTATRKVLVFWVICNIRKIVENWKNIGHCMCIIQIIFSYI
jgi:hypothetical protein